MAEENPQVEERVQDIPPLTWTVFQDIIRICFVTARRKGWWEKYGVMHLHNTKYDKQDPMLLEVISMKLMLVVSELSEALEELRAGKNPAKTYFICKPGEETPEEARNRKPEGFGVELADAVIRIFDLAGWLGIDLSTLIRQKMKFNETRPHRHGGKKL